MRPDTRLSIQLLGTPEGTQKLPYGSNAIKGDDTPVYRDGCALTLKVLAAAVLVVWVGLAVSKAFRTPVETRGTPNMAKDGYR